MSVLRIDSSPRGGDSNGRALTQYLIDRLRDTEVLSRDLSTHPLHPITAGNLVSLHGSQHRDAPAYGEHLSLSEQLIGELLWADTLVIGIAVHNFSVPVVVKQWIDYVCRAGRTFRYTPDGPAGLSNIDRAFLVVASGGTPVGGAADFASGYMTHICRFLGAREVNVIDAAGSKRQPVEIIARGRAQIDRLLGIRETVKEV